MIPSAGTRSRRADVRADANAARPTGSGAAASPGRAHGASTRLGATRDSWGARTEPWRGRRTVPPPTKAAPAMVGRTSSG